MCIARAVDEMLSPTSLFFLVAFVSADTDDCSRLVSFGRTPCCAEGLLSVANDYSGRYWLSVDVSVPYATERGLSGDVDNLEEIKFRPVDYLFYRIRFEDPEVLPKVIKVTFNGEVICRSVGYSPSHDRSATTITMNVRMAAPVQRARRDEVRRRLANNPFLKLATNPFLKNVITEAPKTESRNPFFEENEKDADVCGTTSVGLIYNGRNAQIREVPWMGALLYDKDGSYEYICAATLISEKYTLTAAHCLKNSLHSSDKDLYLLLFGLSRIADRRNKGTSSKIAEYTVHPDYDERQHDLAVVRLASPLTYTNSILPACLWNFGENLNLVIASGGLVAGWGSTGEGVTVSDRLQKIRVAVVSHDTCVMSNSKLAVLSSSFNFCAGYRNSSGPCTGDSGAGLLVEVNGRYYLRGVVSFALAKNNRCDLDNYVVYADVAKDLDWITKATAR